MPFEAELSPPLSKFKLFFTWGICHERLRLCVNLLRLIKVICTYGTKAVQLFKKYIYIYYYPQGNIKEHFGQLGQMCK